MFASESNHVSGTKEADVSVLSRVHAAVFENVRSETSRLHVWKNRIIGAAVSLCKRARKGWKAQDPKAGMFFRMRQSASHRTHCDSLWLCPGLYDKKTYKNHRFSPNVSPKCPGTQFPALNNWHSKSHRPIALPCIILYHCSLYTMWIHEFTSHLITTPYHILLRLFSFLQWLLQGS